MVTYSLINKLVRNYKAFSLTRGRVWSIIYVMHSLPQTSGYPILILIMSLSELNFFEYHFSPLSLIVPMVVINLFFRINI